VGQGRLLGGEGEVELLGLQVEGFEIFVKTEIDCSVLEGARVD